VLVSSLRQSRLSITRGHVVIMACHLPSSTPDATYRQCLIAKQARSQPAGGVLRSVGTTPCFLPSSRENANMHVCLMYGNVTESVLHTLEDCCFTVLVKHYLRRLRDSLACLCEHKLTYLITTYIYL